MSKFFKFSKGSLEVDGARVFGTIKASTSMQQSPDNLVIDTTVDKFGPISINEIKQFRYVLPFVAFFVCIVVGCLIGVGFVVCFSGSGFGVLVEALQKLVVILLASMAVGVIVSAIIFVKLRIYMAQFSNGGQIVYVPYIKKVDRIVLKELNDTIWKLKHKPSRW